MKTDLIALCIASGLALACNGGGGSTASDATMTSPGTTSATAPTGTTGDGPVTGTDANTGGSTDTTSPPLTSTTEEPVTTTLTTATATTGADTGGTSTSGGTSTGGTDDTGDSSTSEPGTTGGDPGGKCMKDGDCTLLSDCCRCEAIAVGDPIPDCDVPECFVPQCDALGVDSVSCRFGTCVAEKLNCDASAIACDALPPDCPAGQLPGVDANGTCWTNGCVPIDLCNVVPNCDLCPNGQMCVTDETLFGLKRRCEPIPPECMGQKPSCACAMQACDQGQDSCMDNDDGLYCFCPNC
ncbi:MAG: hypothetical protein JNL82_32740 [Myxococcales bacterium]|nr:hypothetical protein [Myxococcales bacterium]